MALLCRPWDAPPGETARDVKLIVQRELTTVGGAREALTAALVAREEGGCAGTALRLVVAGQEMLDDTQVLWDMGLRPRKGPALYYR